MQTGCDRRSTAPPSKHSNSRSGQAPARARAQGCLKCCVQAKKHLCLAAVRCPHLRVVENGRVWLLREHKLARLERARGDDVPASDGVFRQRQAVWGQKALGPSADVISHLRTPCAAEDLGMGRRAAEKALSVRRVMAGVAEGRWRMRAQQKRRAARRQRRQGCLLLLV